MREIFHVKTPDALNDSHMHLSHLYPLISAFEISEEQIKAFHAELIEALKQAAEERRSVVVDSFAGDQFIVCYPSGYFALCCSRKYYQFLTQEEHKKIFPFG